MNLSLYQQELMEHYRYSPFRGSLMHADFSSEDHNPSCGDRLAFQGRISDGSITDIRFTGSGCVLSQATASLLAENCIGKTVDDILKLHSADMVKLIHLQVGPNRFKCVLLSLEVLQQAIKIYQKRTASE